MTGAEEAVIKAALKFDDVMSEFDGEIRYCGETMDALFDAVAKLRIERNRASYGSQRLFDKLRGADEAPVGWISAETFMDTWQKAMAYRRQLIASGIKPDLETYRKDASVFDLDVTITDFNNENLP